MATCKTLLLMAVCLVAVLAVNPPGPVCRTRTLPNTIPLSIGETARFDLEEIFDGYNLVFEGNDKDHIKVTPKYTYNETHFNSSIAFTSAKIKGHGRFLGLVSRQEFTELVIGTNHPDTGVSIEKIIQIEDVPHAHCYDVDEIYNRVGNKSYAIIDCGVFDMGRLTSNEFLYVDLESYKLFIGAKETDVFVQYHHVSKRRIEIIEDPFNHVEYMYRFYTADGVDAEHQDQTYVEIFILGQTHVDFRLFDVIDYTFFPLHSLSILDYQIHFNFVYLLLKDHGLVQLRVTPDQHLRFSGFMPIKLNVQKFRVAQLGFNDDLHVVLANDNTVYQYEWDAILEPKLVNKYSLMSGAEVEQILLDNHLIIVQAKNIVADQIDRRVWIYSRRTASFTNVYGSFKIQNNEPHIMIYEGTGRSLHLISSYSTFNIRFSLPYLQINPVGAERAGSSEDYVVTATSKTPNGSQIQCKQTLHLTYIENTNSSIFKTGLQFGREVRVDSPDQYEIPLMYEFFGPNITYNISFEGANDSIKSYVDKQHLAHVNFPPNISKSSIVYFEMYTETSRTELDDRETVYGLVQTQDGDNFPLHQIKCTINVQDQDQEHTLACLSLSVTNLPYGKVLRASQMFSPHQRFIALVFQKEERSVFLYYLYSTGLNYYGQKNFDYTFGNTMTGVEITNKKQLIITFEYSKRIEVYHLDDLHYSMSNATAIFTIDYRTMQFFGISYFAPVDVKISIHHDEVAFIKTKSGVMAININQAGFPELLFHVPTSNALYDFEIGEDTLAIVTPQATSLYRLTLPLSRAQPPYLKNKLSGDYSLNEYSEINSDGFFYLVEHSQERVLVVHPDMPSTSIIYTEINFGKVLMMDAVRLTDKELLFVYTGSEIQAWVLADNPKLSVEWQPYQTNFTLNFLAYNEKATSESYTTNFTVIESDEAFIKPTPKFNATKVLSLGHLEFNKNDVEVSMNITIPDMDWFSGNVMRYNISCKDCHKNHSESGPHISLIPHVYERRQVVYVGEPVYDLQSSWNGIYGQMYNGFFKTFQHNDSVEFIAPLPQIVGQACTKMAIGEAHEYVLSFCELGDKLHIYLTSLVSFKPHTLGPFESEARAINHAKVVDNILMIVDNDDDPFRRAGGIYLYYINFNAALVGETIEFLDYLSYEDLWIDGFEGLSYIASADIIKPYYIQDDYTIFLTEARGGNIFAFNFHLTPNKQEIVYLQRKVVYLNKLIPDSALHPEPLRVLNIDVIDKSVFNKGGRLDYEFILLLTVSNWHHIEVMVTFDEEYDLLAFELVRLYERVPYPWKLTNYVKVKKGNLDASYFAVTYRDFDFDRQVVAVYELPRFKLNQKTEELRNGIPITRALGGHRVWDTSEICFDFHLVDDHRLLLNDVQAPNITQIEFNKNLTIVIKKITPSEQPAENITLIAMNYYNNFTYNIELSFDEEKLDERTEIIWILILIIGFLMIIGLIVVWSKQSKLQERDSIKQSLLTVDPDFKNNYINRSSADPNSIRGTVDFEDTPERTMQREREPEETTEQRLEANQDPLNEQIQAPEQEKKEEAKQA